MKNSKYFPAKNSGSPQQNAGKLTTSLPPQKNINKVQNQSSPMRNISGSQNSNAKNYPQPQSNINNMQNQPLASKSIAYAQNQMIPNNNPPSKNSSLTQNQATLNKNIVGPQTASIPNKNQMSSLSNPPLNYQGSSNLYNSNISNKIEEAKLLSTKQNYPQYQPISQNPNLQNLNSSSGNRIHNDQISGYNIDNIKKYETYLNEACTPGIFPLPLPDYSKYLRNDKVYEIPNSRQNFDYYMSRNAIPKSYPSELGQGIYDQRYEERISRYNTLANNISRESGMINKNDGIVDSPTNSFKYNSPFKRSYSIPRNNFLDINDSLNYLNDYSKKYIRNPDRYVDYPIGYDNSRLNTLSPNFYYISSRMRNFDQFPKNRFLMERNLSIPRGRNSYIDDFKYNMTIENPSESRLSSYLKRYNNNSDRNNFISYFPSSSSKYPYSQFSDGNRSLIRTNENEKAYFEALKNIEMKNRSYLGSSNEYQRYLNPNPQKFSYKNPTLSNLLGQL